MSSARFNRLVSDAWKNDDINAARDAYHDWQISHCLHPSMQRIYDAHTQTERFIQIPCGKCSHCVESKINEWCTRMYAHAEDFKNVYFVTLTYRSVTNPYLPVNQLLLNKLSFAIWNNDSFNSTMHKSYNPCLLQKSHYQNFLKRLRKNTGLKDLTYVLSGEYGSKFGRPHFHLLLFTNGTLTKTDICRAWSVCLWKNSKGEWSYRTNQKNDGQAFDFPIGRVDFNDLVQNGTFNTTAKVRVDGTYMNAANCFSYVCKYVCKRDKVNYCRVNLAYNNTHHKEEYVDCYGHDIPYNDIEEFVKMTTVLPQPIEAIKKSLKNYTYEKIIFKPNQNVFKYGLCSTKPVTIQNFTFDKVLFEDEYINSRNQFEPFCEFSRGCPIGSVYTKRNIQEFTQGVFTKPLLQDAGFVVPNYFVRKAREYNYGFRELHKTLSGVSPRFSGLIDLQGQLSCLAKIDSDKIAYTISSPDGYPIEKAVHLFNRQYIDLYSREHIRFDRKSKLAIFEKFNRSTKKYDCTRTMPLCDFAKDCLNRLQLEYDSYNKCKRIAQDNLRLQESAFLIMTDLGDEKSSLVKRFELQNDLNKQTKQRDYNELHFSAE